MQNTYLAEAEQLFPYTQDMRRDFHIHPELGFQEIRTAGIVAQELTELGYEVKTQVAKTGVVALLHGERPGPTVLLRFDMDALPVFEDSSKPYASQNPGVMHACGHDGHTAVGLTVGKMLQKRKSEIGGKVKLIFQPAEEGLGGAPAMISDGILENPRPDIALALHVWNEKPLGWLGISAGPVMAASEIFTVCVHGKGGHGALPHQAVDPVVASTQIINALQSIVSRNISPLETAVVSVTMIHGGDAFNVIPSQVEIKGTIRTFDPEVRSKVLERFRNIVARTAEAMNCEAEIQITPLTPAVINNGQVSERVLKIAGNTLPQSNLETNFQTMGSEDMAFILKEIPGCFIFVGSSNSDQDLVYPHHHPRFDIDEMALSHGAALLTAAALDYLI